MIQAYFSGKTARVYDAFLEKIRHVKNDKLLLICDFLEM